MTSVNLFFLILYINHRFKSDGNKVAINLISSNSRTPGLNLNEDKKS